MEDAKQLDYIEALKSILTVNGSKSAGPRAVLTTAPWLWFGDNVLSDDDRIIDISFKFPRQRQYGSDAPIRDSSFVKTELYNRLLFAGWRPDQIDTRASRQVEGLGQSDFLVKTDSKQYVAFFIVNSQFLRAENERTVFARAKGHSPQWIVLTDGISFWIVNSVTSEAMLLSTPPNPELIELVEHPGTKESNTLQEIIDEVSYRLEVTTTKAASSAQPQEIEEWLQFEDCRNWGEAAKSTVTSFEVCEQLINKGWRTQELFRQEAADEIDIRSEIIVRNHGSFPIMALCLVSSAVLAEETNSSLFERHVDSFPDLPQVIWLAITDGISYRLKNLLTFEFVCLNKAPSREFLFATQGSTQNQQKVFRPRTTAQLVRHMQELEPSSVILDFTIDSERSVAPPNDYISLDEIEYDKGLEDLVSNATKWVHSYSEGAHYCEDPEDEQGVTFQQIIVSWFANRPSIEQIAFVSTRQLASSSRYKDFRKNIVEQISLAAVLEVPPPSQDESKLSSTPDQLLVVYLARSFKETLFQRFSSAQLGSSQCSGSLRLWLTDKKISVGGTASVASISSWEPRANASFLIQLKDRLNRIGQLRELNSLAYVYDGRPPSNISTSQMRGVEGQRTIELAVVDSEALRNGVSKKFFVSGPDNLYQMLEPGDILIPRRISRSAECLQFQDTVPSIAGKDIIVISAWDNDQASYIFSFLNSTAGKELLMSKGQPTGDSVDLTVNDLNSLLIPECHNKEALDSMNELASIERGLQAKIRAFSVQRKEIFDEQNGKKFFQKIAELRRHGRVLSTGLDRAVEFEYCVSNFYPYPIAFPFRTLQSQTVPAEQYQSQLRLAENLLAFLASISLAITLDTADLSLTGVDLKSTWIGGASPGHWKELIRKCGIYFLNCVDNPLAIRINQLDIAATGKPFGQNIANLIGSKNDFKHDRGPTNTDQYIAQIPENQAWLLECMKSMMFLTEYPIRQVCDTDESRQGQISLTCLRLDGDHPGFKKERVPYCKHLTKRDLFLEISTDYWIPLYPFVQLLACKTCGAPECYFIDKLDYSRRLAVLKSFERGHTAESTDVGESLCNIIDSIQTSQPLVPPTN